MGKAKVDGEVLRTGRGHHRPGLIWLAESTAGWFFVREKYCWLADLTDNLKRTAYFC
jgi:hypothetical protein